VPFTVNVKEPAVKACGLTLEIAGTGLSRVIALLAVALASAALVAPSVTVFELGTLPGAVYRPAEVTVPTDALPPATPFTVQLTD
jgi:hypothetical protein